MKTRRRISRLALGLALLGLGLAADAASAQMVVSGATTPVYSTTVPATGYIAPVPGAYTYPGNVWYAARPSYVSPSTYQYTYPGYYYPSAGRRQLQHYRNYIDSGRDPNYPARRGLRLYKPWLY